TRTHFEHERLWSEARAYVAVAAIRREDDHAGPVGHWNADDLAVTLRVEHGDVILASHAHPDLAPVGREESLVRRTADVGDVLHRVAGRVDECHRVRSDRYGDQGAMVRRKAKPVHEQLPAVQRAQVSRLRVTETNRAESGVARRVDDRNRV